MRSGSLVHTQAEHLPTIPVSFHTALAEMSSQAIVPQFQCAVWLKVPMHAGITATVTCFPLDVMRTRVMGPGGHVYGGVISTFSNLLQKEGVSSMYVGLLPAVISMAPAGAVFYGVYDLLKVTLTLLCIDRFALH